MATFNNIKQKLIDLSTVELFPFCKWKGSNYYYNKLFSSLMNDEDETSRNSKVKK